jgi:hypothetical protein
MDFTGTGNIAGSIDFNANESVVLKNSTNILPVFVDADTNGLTKVSAVGSASNIWYAHMAVAQVTSGNTWAKVQANETIAGKSRAVVRFSQPTVTHQNSGIFIRKQLSGIPAAGQYYYVRTWLKHIDGTMSAAAGSNELRYGLCAANNTAAAANDGNYPVRAQLPLGMDSGNAANTLLTTGVWKEFSFVIKVPATYENYFFELRLFVVNGSAAITVDMAEVEMYKVELDS